MTKLFLYIALTSVVIFSSCSLNDIDNEIPNTNETEITLTNQVVTTTLDAGQAYFTIDNVNSQLMEKDPLLLSNKSTNAVSYLWDFGNGDTSTEANPTYSYDLHGTFDIKLTIVDKYDNVQESSHLITVICPFAGQDHGSN